MAGLGFAAPQVKVGSLKTVFAKIAELNYCIQPLPPVLPFSGDQGEDLAICSFTCLSGPYALL